MEISSLYFDDCKVKSSNISLDSEYMWINVVNCDLTGVVKFLMSNIESGTGFNIGIDTDDGYYESICSVGEINEKEKSFVLCLHGKINKGSNEQTNTKD